MSQELFFRTEDLKLEELKKYFVETAKDRAIVDKLKGRSPIVLRGSRGVGKSFLLRVAESEMKASFTADRILPVYVTFARAGLIRQTPEGFLPWMVSKIATSVTRALTSYGLVASGNSSLVRLVSGESGSGAGDVEAAYEEFWQGGGQVTGAAGVPDPEALRHAIEDLCEEQGLSRIALLVDEAAHVFIPEQQRQFFTLMRDLRSPYLSVKASVYPGATAYGESFQPSHDATILDVERLVGDDSYAPSMRDIVLKQDPSLRREIEHRGDIFDTLSFAATGNPRILLKTLSRSLPINATRVQASIREYYREEIWSEHSALADRYPGHRQLIDWGRTFLESEVLPALHARNQRDNETSSAIWIHRDAPQAVREALRLLCYSGILQEGVSGIRATRSEVGTRYMVNFGCGFAQDSDPLSYGSRIRRSFSIKRMQEFGANHSAYRAIQDVPLEQLNRDGNAALEARLDASAQILDLTYFQKQKLQELNLDTIGQVLGASEAKFKTLHYVGDVRARQIRNAAIIAVIEYLSG